MFRTHHTHCKHSTRLFFELLEERTLLATATFSVDVRAPWRDTGIDLEAGQRLQISVAPEDTANFGYSTVNANGVGRYFDGTGRRADAVLPEAIVLSLIGKVGGTTSIDTGTPLPEGASGKGAGFVGTTYDRMVPEDGRLFLGFNDLRSFFGDNSGSFVAEITVDVSQPDIAATSLSIEEGAVSYAFAISGSDLSEDTTTTVGLYWSADNTFDDGDSVAFDFPITGDFRKVGEHANSISVSKLLDSWAKHNNGDQTLPDGTTHLLLVVDASNVIEESDELESGGFGENNVKGILLVGDVAITDAITRDFKSYSISYDVSLLPSSPFEFRYYQSNDETWDAKKDTFLGLDLVSDDSMLAVGEDLHHTTELSTTITYDQRFIIVVAADPSKSPYDQSSVAWDRTDANNQAFVIPLFEIGPSSVHGGGFIDRRYVPAKKELDYVNPIDGRISQGTFQFFVLADISNVWQQTEGEYTRTIKREEPIKAFKDDDQFVHASLLAPLAKLASLVEAARGLDRFNSKRLEITDAYDEEGEHKPESLHYEGRAIDFGVDMNDSRPELLARLAGLTMLAGFHRFDNEVNRYGESTLHVHVSHNGGSPRLTANSIRGALDFAHREDVTLVTDPAYGQLTSLIDGAIEKLADPDDPKRERLPSELSRQERRELLSIMDQFRRRADRAERTGELRLGRTATTEKGDPKLKEGLVLYNARKLIDQIIRAFKARTHTEEDLPVDTRKVVEPEVALGYAALGFAAVDSIGGALGESVHIGNSLHDLDSVIDFELFWRDLSNQTRLETGLDRAVRERSRYMGASDSMLVDTVDVVLSGFASMTNDQ